MTEGIEQLEQLEEIEPTRAGDDLGSPWEDLRAFVATPRWTGLIMSADGRRLVATVSEPNHDQTAYRSALWNVDPTGEKPARRLTRSVEGEASAAFLAGGDLLFTSKRALPADDADSVAETEAAIWCLPADGGEAYVAARRDGGWGTIVAARNAPLVVLATPMHVGTENEDADRAKRADRRKRKIGAILHDGYPVRFWDHDLGPEAARLTSVDLDSARSDDGDLAIGDDQLLSLTGDVGRAVRDGSDLSDDGSRLVVEWRIARPRGVTTVALESFDTRTGERSRAAEDEVDDFVHPVLSADGSLLAAVHEQAPTEQTAPDSTLVLIDADGGRRQLAEDWDAWPTPIAFSPDASTLYVRVDELGHGPLYAVDVATGSRRRLTPAGASPEQDPGFGSFASAVLSPDGSTLYAIRSSYADPGTVVAVATDGSGIRELRSVSCPPLPGTVHEVETTAADGVRVRGWLLLPTGASADQPTPLALWVHGGPLGSWNAWSWRWCPWLMVSRGYAVLLPDPALSTGYGRAFIQRGWGRWGAEPYTDLMTLTDTVLERPVIDPRAPIAMGGSFGGYMANWIAGHTDRFAGIVTHASL